MGSCNKKPLAKEKEQSTAVIPGKPTLKSNPFIRKGTEKPDISLDKNTGKIGAQNKNGILGFEVGISQIIDDKSGSLIDQKNPLTPKPLPSEKIKELSQLRKFEDIEANLISEATLSCLSDNYSANSIINVLIFENEEDKLKMSWVLYLRIKEEETKTEAYSRNENMISEFIKMVIRIVEIELRRAQQLSFKNLYNKEVPNKCLESMLITWHVLLTHRKKHSNQSITVWWNKRGEDRKLESVLSKLIDMSGKIRYEFEIKVSGKNLLESVLSRSGTRDVAFDGEFRRRRSEVRDTLTTKDIIQFPEDMEEYLQDDDDLKKRKDFPSYEIRTNKMEKKK